MTNLEEKVGDTILIQPSNNGGSLGKVVINLNANNEITNKVGSFISTSGVSEDADLANSLSSYDERAKKDAETPIGNLVGPSLADENEIADIPESLVRDQGVTDFVNEVQLYNSAKHLEDKDINPADVYLVSAAALFDADSNM